MDFVSDAVDLFFFSWRWQCLGVWRFGGYRLWKKKYGSSRNVVRVGRLWTDGSLQTQLLSREATSVVSCRLCYSMSWTVEKKKKKSGRDPTTWVGNNCASTMILCERLTVEAIADEKQDKSTEKKKMRTLWISIDEYDQEVCKEWTDNYRDVQSHSFEDDWSEFDEELNCTLDLFRDWHRHDLDRMTLLSFFFEGSWHSLQEEETWCLWLSDVYDQLNAPNHYYLEETIRRICQRDETNESGVHGKSIWTSVKWFISVHSISNIEEEVKTENVCLRVIKFVTVLKMESVRSTTLHTCLSRNRSQWKRDRKRNGRDSSQLLWSSHDRQGSKCWHSFRRR